MKPAANNPDYETSIAGWSFALATALEVHGFDSIRVFHDAGIDLPAVESAEARLPISSVQKVWRFAAENTDEYFGVRVSEFLNPASFHALGFALHTSSSLKELLERLIRYRCVISHLFFCELLDEYDVYRLVVHDERIVKTDITHDAFYSYLIRLARALQHPDFSPLEVHSLREARPPVKSLNDFFGLEVKFNAGASAMTFSKESLEQGLRHGNPDLAASLDKSVEQYIAAHGLISEYMLRVRNAIYALLEHESVSINHVADRLNVTVRTLQRRLAAENSSYNDLLDHVRRQLAMDYIKNPNTNATQIAFRLGFSDSGSFGRSFKRWTGSSFIEYRERSSQ